MAMAGTDLLEKAWLELAATTPRAQEPRAEYRLEDELPPCALCGWPETVAFKGSVVCMRCRTQMLGAMTPTPPAPHDELGRFLSV
jgi:hypothetical protein